MLCRTRNRTVAQKQTGQRETQPRRVRHGGFSLAVTSPVIFSVCVNLGLQAYSEWRHWMRTFPRLFLLTISSLCPRRAATQTFVFLEYSLCFPSLIQVPCCFAESLYWNKERNLFSYYPPSLSDRGNQYSASFTICQCLYTSYRWNHWMCVLLNLVSICLWHSSSCTQRIVYSFHFCVSIS